MKRPKLDPLSEKGLRRKTELYLRRYWPSVVQMRRVLVRHIDRNFGRWGGDKEAALALLDPLLDELKQGGKLNDERFTRSWVEQLDRKGLSRLAILSKMREKGIERDLVEAELERIDHLGGNRELFEPSPTRKEDGLVPRNEIRTDEKCVEKKIWQPWRVLGFAMELPGR